MRLIQRLLAARVLLSFLDTTVYYHYSSKRVMRFGVEEVLDRIVLVLVAIS